MYGVAGSWAVLGVYGVGGRSLEVMYGAPGVAGPCAERDGAWARARPPREEVGVGGYCIMRGLRGRGGGRQAGVR